MTDLLTTESHAEEDAHIQARMRSRAVRNRMLQRRASQQKRPPRGKITTLPARAPLRKTKPKTPTKAPPKPKAAAKQKAKPAAKQKPKAKRKTKVKMVTKPVRRVKVTKRAPPKEPEPSLEPEPMDLSDDQLDDDLDDGDEMDPIDPIQDEPDVPERESRPDLETTSTPVTVAQPSGQELSNLYEQFLELTVYHAWSKHDPEDAEGYPDDQLQLIRVMYDRFKDRMEQMVNLLFYHLMAGVSQAPNVTPDNPILQLILLLFRNPCVHFEEATASRAAIEAGGHSVTKTPVACVWCGSIKSKGPPKNMYRIKVNSYDENIEPIGAYVCKNECGMLAMAYNVFHFQALVQRAVEQCLDSCPPDLSPDAPWSDVYVAIVGERGRKKMSVHRPTGTKTQRLIKSVKKWPSKAKKGTDDPPMVFVATHWRDMLNQAQQVVDTLVAQNFERHKITISFDGNGPEAEDGPQTEPPQFD